MNPGVDAACTGVLPHAAAVAATVAATSGSVARPETTSTSGISGTGLKKCMPTMRPGRPLPCASAVIDSDDVLDARMAWASTSGSSCANSARLAARSSTMASTTSPATQASASVPTVTMRASAASARSRVSFARPTSLSKVSASDFFAASAAPKRVSCSCTGWPASAAICAMPAPIVPAPMTATVAVVGSAAATRPPAAAMAESGSVEALAIGTTFSAR